MAYDVFYYDRRGRREAGFDSAVAAYDTALRNKMLKAERGYAEAIQIDHPARPCVHWNGRAWMEGPFDFTAVRRY